jgi:hypothetical protein
MISYVMDYERAFNSIKPTPDYERFLTKNTHSNRIINYNFCMYVFQSRYLVSAVQLGTAYEAEAHLNNI